ncbi:gliding motility-associated C-terminal domain-containing protein [Ferruginibacter yonginensis]|uniref:Gliding motility-associated C-terminal domain-containing protein n=1 Tax=Ferruginibacter yonginensis TaxID=1310416 RepID=A0ABV8QSA8_9BACT
MKQLYIFIVSMIFFVHQTNAQVYAPITLTGFNHDVIAEAGTSSLTTTTVAMDGVTVSNKVMYTNAFRLANGFGGGGIPDNGTFTSGTATYQLAAYTGNNVLLVPRNQNGDLNFATPAKYSALRLLVLSTEGASLINATVFFTDGTSVNALTNTTVGDWFNGTTNVVAQGFGRCTRATPASGADAFTANPRLYYIEVPISCANRQKDIQKINIANVTTAGSNAPFPNAIVFAVSGVTYSQTVAPTVTNATCSANGTATLNIIGSSGPYSVTWNTTPVQTGVTATNLTPNSYVATITDAASCVSTSSVTVTLTNNLTLTTRLDTTICSNVSINANTNSNAANYTWTAVPAATAGISNATAANPTLAPTAPFTTYTVTATLGSNCTTSRSFSITVQPAVTASVRSDTTICSGAAINANTVSNATSYLWTASPAATAGISNATIANPVLSPTAALTTYTLTASIGNCSIIRTFRIAVAPSFVVDAGNTINILQGSSAVLQATAPAGTYLWTPATGLSATNILNPTASPGSTTTYTLKVTSPQGCTATDDVTVNVLPFCIKPMEAITPNGDGINDKWLVTSGGNCTKLVKVNVYNRYGSRVYSSTNYQNDWQGTYKDKALPDGTYYFVIQYFLIDGSQLERKGNVTILR